MFINVKSGVKWKKYLYSRLPVIEWLPRYSISSFLHDLLAGFTVALTKVPQCIAYASIAGLDPQYGLYSSFMGVFVYFLLGTCKDVNVGPTSVICLMVLPHVLVMGPAIAVLITFMTGVIIILFGLFQVGFILRFFSFPVISSFTTAVALQLMSTQMRPLLGFTGNVNSFLDSWISTFENIQDVQLWDTLLGLLCMVFILGTKFLGKKKGRSSFNPKSSPTENVIAISIWVSSIINNAVVVLIASVIAYILYNKGYNPFTLTGSIPSGFPQLSLPAFTTTYNNQTYTFSDMVNQLGVSIVFIPIITVLAHVSTAKAIVKGKNIDATQELYALGVGNFLSSFVQSMPVTGTFSRTAINNVSGVKTTAGGLFTGSFVLLSLSFLTSYFYYIPKATLAAVVISSMTGSVEYETILILWKTSKIELVPYFATLFGCLLWNMEYGILIGILSNAVIVLYFTSKPQIQFVQDIYAGKKVSITILESNLYYSAAEYLVKTVLKYNQDLESIIVLDGGNVKYIDTTVAKNFKTLINQVKLQKKSILFWNFNEKIINTLLSYDPQMKEYFVNGLLDDVIISEVAEVSSNTKNETV